MLSTLNRYKALATRALVSSLARVQHKLSGSRELRSTAVNVQLTNTAIYEQRMSKQQTAKETSANEPRRKSVRRNAGVVGPCREACREAQ